MLNKTLGGDEDNVDPGIRFLAELVKKNEAVIIENTDAAMKAFARGASASTVRFVSFGMFLWRHQGATKIPIKEIAGKCYKALTGEKSSD